MSDYLIISGIVVPVRRETDSIGFFKVGAGLSRAQDASLRDNFNAVKKTYKATTSPMSQETAGLLAAFLRQETDHYPWLTTLLSDKGQSPSTSTAATVGAGGPWSHGQMSLGATTGQVTYVGIFDGRGATILISRYESAAWHDYEIVIGPTNTSYACAALFKDGAVQSTAYPSWFVVTGGTGTIQIKNTSGSPVLYGEMVVINATTTSAAVAATMNTFRTTYFPPTAPAFQCYGDFNEIPLQMMSATDTAKVFSAAGQPGMRQISLDLQEV